MTKAETEEETGLKTRLAELEERERICNKFGVIAERDIKYYQEQEREEARLRDRKKFHDERGAREAQERAAEIRETAPTLVSTGRLIISVNNQRVDAIGENLAPPCPFCGAPLTGHPSAHISRLTNMWIHKPENSLDLTVRNAHGPLGPIQGSPMISESVECPACRARVGVSSLLIII